MSVEENKAVLKKFFEESNKGNIDAIDEAHSPDYVHHWHGGTKDFEEVKEMGRGFLGTTFSVDDMIAEGDRVALWGTVSREGKDDSHWCWIYRFSGGKIVETWNMISLQGSEKGMLP